MLLQDKKSTLKSISLAALFLALSVIISIVESVSGINNLLVIPGLKLGLCNVAVTGCIYLCGNKSGLCVALLRPVLLFLFSGNVFSLGMSFCGGMLSYLSVVLTKKLYGKTFSFCGVSCISAVCHSIGQICFATAIMQDLNVLYYLPLLCALSSVSGTFCGFVMNLVIPRLGKVLSTMGLADGR